MEGRLSIGIFSLKKVVLYSNLKFRWGLAPSSPPPPPPCWASRCSWRSPWSLRQFLKPPSIFPSNICMSFNLRYYFLVSDNKQRNYNSMSGPPSKFVVVSKGYLRIVVHGRVEKEQGVYRQDDEWLHVSRWMAQYLMEQWRENNFPVKWSNFLQAFYNNCKVMLYERTTRA